MSGLQPESIPTGVFLSEQVQAFVSMVRAEIVHALREIRQTYEALKSRKCVDLRTVADTCLLPYNQLSLNLENKETNEILLRHCHFASFQNLFLLEYSKAIQDTSLGYQVVTDYSPVSAGKFMSYVYTFLYDHQEHFNLLNQLSETELSLCVYSAMRRAAAQTVRVIKIAEMPKCITPDASIEVSNPSFVKDTSAEDDVSPGKKDFHVMQSTPQPEPEPELEPQPELQMTNNDIQPSDSVSNVGQTTSIETQMQPFLRSVTVPSVLMNTDPKSV